MMKTADVGRFLTFSGRKTRELTLAKASFNTAWNTSRRAFGWQPVEQPGLLDYGKQAGIRAIRSLFGIKTIDEDGRLPQGWPRDVFNVISDEISAKGGVIKLEDGVTIPAFRLVTGKAAVLPHMWVAYIKRNAKTADYSKVMGLDDSIKESLSQSGKKLSVRIVPDPLRVEIDRSSAEIIRLADDWELLKAQPRNCYEYLTGTYFDGDILQLGIFDLFDSREWAGIAAGASGSGKSQWALSMLLSAALNTSPDLLSMVICDPKNADFTTLKALPHLAYGQILSEVDHIRIAIKAIEAEMDRRVRTGDRNIARKRILLFIDEWPDVSDQDTDKSIENAIIRLSQKGRFWGINLFLAAQKTTSAVLNTRILANLPARFCLRVGSFDEAKFVSGQSGCYAHKLPGNGSALIYNPQFSDGLRTQSHFVGSADDPKFDDLVGVFVSDVCGVWSNSHPHWLQRLTVDEPQSPVIPEATDNRSQAVDFPFEFEMAMYQLFLDDKDKFSRNKIRQAHKDRYGTECRNERATRLYTRITGNMDA